MSLPPPTQSKSSLVYKWVILFLHCEDTEFPFSCVSLSSLAESNFPFQAINGSMDDNLRKEPIVLSWDGEEPQKYCIFCKVEEGN